MQVVDKAVNFPARCVFTGSTDGKFLDTGFWLNARELDGVDPYAYISVAFVETMGREVGMVAANEVERLQERVAAQDDRINELERLVDALGVLNEITEEVSV
jgi:hypothetical protein